MNIAIAKKMNTSPPKKRTALYKKSATYTINFAKTITKNTTTELVVCLQLKY